MVSLLFVSQPFMLKGQDDGEGVGSMSTRERIFVGGSLGLQFGTITAISVSPIAGYWITNRLAAGIGGTYQYYNDRSFGQSFTTSVYGGGVFTRFLLIPEAFLHAEYEKTSLESYRFAPGSDQDRIWEDNYFLGAGYRLRMGEKAFFNIMLLFNLNDDSRVYYQNPLLRFGVDIGL